ncbi:MAG: hypothetical protein OXE87_01205 [Chloroflexi bacterium]|nr:hypothetical protein [Chloroflexota bacterium]
MTTLLLQETSFRAVSPAALGGFVRSLNWVKNRPYRDVSDVYVGEGLPEIIVPRTQRIDDYAFIVGRLIDAFSKVADTDPVIIYHELVNADRDVIRVRVPEADEDSLPIEQGVGLVSGARDLLLAAACSLEDRRPVYRVGSNQAAMDYLRRVRLGHTEQGSFAVTLLPPVVPPEVEPPGEYEHDGRVQEDPLERRMTGHFANTLSATKSAAEETASGSSQAFIAALASGASANFYDAMVSLIGPFPELEVSVSWALTRPVAIRKSASTFFQDDSPILRAASDSFRARGPKHDVRLFGKVGRLVRDDGDEDGRITVRASVDGRVQSVSAVLSWEDYETAIITHHGGAVLGLEGDLERVGQRWHLRNPRVVDIISLDDSDDGSDAKTLH